MEEDTLVENEGVQAEENTLSLTPAAAFVMERYQQAKTGKEAQLNRMQEAYKNYRGIVEKDDKFLEDETSSIFVKVTKVKVLAAYGQIVEVLFGNSKFPLSINPSVIPEGVEESAHIETNPQLNQLPDTSDGSFKERLGPYDKFKESGSLKEGPGEGPTSVTIEPAALAAKLMEKQIHDQLDASNASKHLRKAALECALFGTGIMKGPFTVDKEYPKWSATGEYTPVFETVPKVTSVSVWDFFPDPDAYTMEEAQYVIERHKMARRDLRALKKRPFFNREAIEAAIDDGANYTKEYYETYMEDDNQSIHSERFEVFEFWGYVDADLLEEYGVELTNDIEDKTEVCVNAWVCNGRVIRFIVNPFNPATIPYYVMPYEINPYSIFGIGVAENMEDTQRLMNGFMRLAIDNAALSGNVMFEVDETLMKPGQDMRAYPGKKFYRQGGAPGHMMHAMQVPNVANQNLQLFEKARVLADESTGFPSFAHGQTGVQGVGRTASGISMLMSAAHGSIRTVVKNVDDYLLAPMGRALFAYNMQYNFDERFVGDLEVKAEGTASLMANEVRSQRLMQFLSIVQNPTLAPFAKMDYIIREIAESMDLDPSKVTNSMAEAALQAEMLQAMQQPAQGPEGPSPTDTQGSGNGNIGTGSVPTPGEQGFSANTGPVEGPPPDETMQ